MKWRAVATLLLLAACTGGEPRDEQQAAVDPAAGDESDGVDPAADEPVAADVPAFAERCTGGAPEEACRRVRMAMQDACGGTVQPSFLDPCRCMCDLCLQDGDCTDGRDGRCVSLSSALLGGYEELVCVYAGDACHPARITCPHCRTYGGHVTCARQSEIDRLERD